MIYLASPYTDPDPLVQQERFETTARCAAHLMRLGVQVFSPICHSHPIARYGLPGEWAFWQRYDRWFLERCDWVMVLQLDGWEGSVGVAQEIAIAAKLGKRVQYCDEIDIVLRMKEFEESLWISEER